MKTPSASLVRETGWQIWLVLLVASFDYRAPLQGCTMGNTMHCGEYNIFLQKMFLTFISFFFNPV